MFSPPEEPCARAMAVNAGGAPVPVIPLSRLSAVVMGLRHHPQFVNGCSDVSKHLPIGQKFRVSSPVFEGFASLNIRGLPGSNAKLFEGKKRYLHLAFQVSPPIAQILSAKHNWCALGAPARQRQGGAACSRRGARLPCLCRRQHGRPAVCAQMRAPAVGACMQQVPNASAGRSTPIRAQCSCHAHRPLRRRRQRASSCTLIDAHACMQSAPHIHPLHTYIHTHTPSLHAQGTITEPIDADKFAFGQEFVKPLPKSLRR